MGTYALSYEICLTQLMRADTSNGIAGIVERLSHVPFSIFINDISKWIIEKNIFIHRVSIKKIHKIANCVIDELNILLGASFVAEV